MVVMLWGVVLLLSFVCFGMSVIVMRKNFDSPMAQKACVIFFVLGVVLLFVDYFIALVSEGKL